MSTADRPGAGIEAAAPSGFPDESELSRLANQIFAELSGHLDRSQRIEAEAQPLASKEVLSPDVPLDQASFGGSELNVDRQLRDDVSATHLSPSAEPALVDPRTLTPAAITVPHDLPSLGGVLSQFPAASDLPYFMVGAVSPPPGVSLPTAIDPGTGSLASPALAPLELAPDPSRAAQPLDPAFIRRDFPILQERINGRQLVWLDNGATTQKPLALIERLERFYRTENSNIHRAAHELAARATDAYEQARATSARFLHAASSEEIMFVRGTTEGINLVAQSWGRRHIEAGDEIVLTHLEHHANIVPWQQLAHEKGARLRIAPVDDSGQVILEAYERLFTSRTKLVAFTQVSNALGTILPAEEMIHIAHRHGARVLLDGAQGIAHTPVDVQALDVDFYVFSGHKIYGPTGIGVLYGKRDLLHSMPPWQGGGNMIRDVTFEHTLYQDPPHRFEAGTGNIADAVSLATALAYVERIGMHAIEHAEQELLAYATPLLQGIPGLRLFGSAAHKAGVLSFLIDGLAPEAVGSALNQEGIAVRAGHHCAQPILRRFGVESTVRATLGVYNTHADVDALVAALRRLRA
ncbi:cysteine desulfurase [Synechococcus sp. Tobar12-5m-g]|uniref:cysteine desulfurase n=1 Tax=unclassified Synechococcus TaxID=2626047 RepID=UPI0020CCCDE7|nr:MULTISPECIES: cysteine desulfurase [unclassified Synechococcus]MCP9772892.1 cysteine desulfurase [Synechococcus sp. Tobar12-5m-g]MCP9873795.1 cysteine desulfurase [Synechococcus sp. Cruz CV-v-12]